MTSASKGKQESCKPLSMQNSIKTVFRTTLVKVLPVPNGHTTFYDNIILYIYYGYTQKKGYGNSAPGMLLLQIAPLF